MGVNVLYDIATGASTRLNRPADLDARGASLKALCPAVRHLVSRYQPKGLFKSFAYQGELFAQGYGKRGDVQLDRCHGRPTILRARGTDDGFGGGEPEDFDLRGELLSWDTGSEAAGYIPPEPKFRGGLYTYGLTTHRRHKWLLPRLTVTGIEPNRGTYGYSTHTANMVFWIASQTLYCDKLCDVEKSGGLRRISEVDTPHAQKRDWREHGHGGVARTRQLLNTTASMRTKAKYLLTAGWLGCSPVGAATFAVVLVMLGVVASRVDASRLRQLARSTTSFASDGGRYAAWQITPASPIVVLDTLDDHEREMKLPGCVLADAERTEATDVTEVTDGDGRFLLSCLKEPGDGCFVADIDSLLRCGEKPLARRTNQE